MLGFNNSPEYFWISRLFPVFQIPNPDPNPKPKPKPNPKPFLVHLNYCLEKIYGCDATYPRQIQAVITLHFPLV